MPYSPYLIWLHVFSTFRNISLWGSAILLLILPVLLAADFGGVYHWSQYVASVGIVVATLFALPGLSDGTASSGLRQHAILLPLGALVGWAWFQGLSLPSGMVGLLSPGSHAAYSQWLDGLVSGDGASRRFSLSVSPRDTAHVAALLSMLLPMCLAASIVFHSRNRLSMLLSGLALAGASVAILGFYRKLDPSADLWMFDSRQTAFAGFVNRNNAALMLNLGLAASLGLLSWRMMALHSIELDDPEFEFNDLMSLIADRESLIGLCSGTACISGLLVNGSRGGLVAAMFGLMFAFGYVRPKRGLLSIPVLAVVLAISVVVLMTPMNLNLESITRWEFFSEDAQTLQSDGRLLHWQDGWRSALAYFPGGAGVASYAYAYLPYQNISPGAWFQHADNLWLEMLVETGVIGLLVAGGFLVLLLISLHRLSFSVDPIDHGIRVAGWYAIAAILVSQFFDFGLAIPANLIAALLLATAIVSRDSANGGAAAKPPKFSDFEVDDPIEKDEQLKSGRAATRGKKIRLRSDGSASGMRGLMSSTRLAPMTLALLTLVLGALSLPGLRQDAISDSMLTRLHDEYEQWRLNPESLERMETALHERVKLGNSPLVLARLARVQRDRGRLEETREWRPQTQGDLLRIYQQTDLQNRELPYPPQPDPPQRGGGKSREHYQDAWQTSLATLSICPLAQIPRGNLLRLQAVVVDPSSQSEQADARALEVARVAAKQLLVFYSGNATRTFELGRESLTRGDQEVASKAFHAALTCNPRLTPQVMKLLRENPAMSVAEVIPPVPEAMRLAVAEYIQWEAPDPNYLAESTSLIAFAGDATMLQRAQSQALVGRIHFFLGDLVKATDYYHRAIRLAPDQASIRVEFIEQLLNHGRDSEALAQARLARQSIADDPRFQRLIDQIADAQRQQTVQPAAGESMKSENIDDHRKAPHG